MDVSFNNVLESTRQYFQGVPPAAVGTGGTPQYNSIANLAGTGGPQSLPAGTTAPSYYQPSQQVSYQNSQQQNYASSKQEYQHQDSIRVPSLAPFSSLNFRTNSKSSTPPRHDYPQYQVLRTPQQQQQLQQEQQNHLHLEQTRHHEQQRHHQEQRHQEQQRQHQEQQRQHQEQQRQHQEQQRQHQEHQRYQQERQHQEQQRYQQEQRLQEHQRQEEQRHQERMQEQQRHHQELQRHNQEQQRIHHEQQRQEHQRLQYQEQQRQRELLRVPQPQEPRPPSQQSLPIRTPTPSQQIKPQLNGNASPGVRSTGSRTPVNYLGYNYHQQIQKPVPPSTSSHNQYEHAEPPRDLTTPHGYYPNQTTPNQVQNHQQQRVQSSIQKRESPLDLSVKTVRQSADSTASDSEQANYCYLQQEYMKNKQQQYMQSYHYQLQNPQYQQPSTAKVEYPTYSDKNQLPQQHDPKRKKENPQMQYYQALPSMGSFAKHYYPNVPPQGKQAQPRPPYPAEHYARQQYPPNYLKRPAHEEVKQSGSSQSSAPVSKQPRVDAWRQSIDQQIEKRFNSYLSSQGVNGDSKKGGYANQPPNFYPDQKQPNGGAADKRVLSILRNSLETKEARNMQQIQQSKQMQYQQMQQKSRGMQPGYQARHNLPPFCAIERATPPQPSPYLHHFPPMPHGYAKPTYPQKEGEAVVDITSDDELRSHNTQGKGEYDGLAAFLAARIRTKAELKQQPPNSANIAPGSSNYNPHATPAFQSSKDLVKSNSVADLLTNTAKGWTYPQKYAKEQAIAANLPRKRLSKPEDGAANFVQMTESSTTTENSPFPIPPRDSGLRSSSEASVFDFRDSDSETDLPVLERQSLNEMRRVGIKREEDPEHEEEYKSWLENCEELVLQLQLGKAYRRKHKKKSRKHILPFVCDIKKEPDADFSNDTKLEVKIKSEPLSGDEKVKQENSEARIFCEPLGTVKKKRGPQNRVKPVVAKKRTKKIKLEFAPIWQEDVSMFKNSLKTSNEISTRIKPPCCPKGSLSLPNLDSFPDIPSSGSNFQNGHSPDKKSISKSLAEEKSFLDRLMQRYLSRKSKNPKMSDKGIKPSLPDSESGFCGFEKEDENRFINLRNDFINSRVSLITNEAFYDERPASAPPPGTTRENLAKLRYRKPEIKKELSHIKKATLLKARLLGKMQEGKKMKTKVKMFRRKLKSSGFDYIRKKKKAPGPKKEGEQPKERKKKTPPMTEQEIQNEIKGWVLNKGLGETILHRASKLGNVETVRYILDKMNHNPAPRDNAGYTPLHEACSRGHVQIVNLLLTYGADVSDSALGGIRPLHEAAENNCIKVVKLLLDHGADPLLATYAGNTALMLATDEEARQLMELHVANCNTPPPSVIKSEDSPCGSQVGESIKQEEPVRDQLENFEIEESEVILPNLYRLANESRAESWVLFHDLAPLLNVKTKEALLKQLGQSSGQILRDLKLSDFLAKAHCRTLKSSTTTAIPTTPRVTLVKYTDTVKFLLGVETSIVPR